MSIKKQYDKIKNKNGLVWASHDGEDVEIFEKGDRDIKHVIESLEKVGSNKFRVYQDLFDRVVVKEIEAIKNPYNLI